MRALLPYIITICVIALPAAADPSRCLKIENSLDRLSCYDDELGFDPAVEQITGEGDWRVQVETSKIDDSTNVFLTLQSREHTNCRYDEAAHRIWIACRENTTSLWVTFGGCFMADNGSRGRVTYRLDQDKAKRRNFRESNDNSALGLWRGGSSIRFIKGMLGHKTLLIRATPFSESTVTAEYDIAGIDEAIKPLRKACRW